MDFDQLLRALRAGEPGAKDTFGYAVFVELRRFFSTSFEPEDAAELTQITFEVVWRKLDSFELRAQGCFVRWLRTIAANKAHVWRQAPHRARARASRLQERQAVVSPRITPSSWTLRRQRLALIERHRATLPEHERRALDHELADGDDQELAEREGIARKTAWSRRHRARLRLAGLIDADRRTPREPPQTPS